MTCAKKASDAGQFARMLSDFTQNDLTGRDLRLVTKYVDVSENKVNPGRLIKELKLEQEWAQVSQIIEQQPRQSA